MKGGDRGGDIVTRLLCNIVRDSDGHWIFTGSRLDSGYGRIGWNGKAWRAHRLSWMLFKGPIPDGLHVLHKCINNRRCCCPDHLYLGTSLENARDRIAQGRHANNRGDNSPCAKMTNEQALDVKRNATRETVYAYAEKYKVHVNTIRNIVYGNQWKCLSA